MPNAAVKQLETLLQARKLDGTLLRPWQQQACPVSPSGIPALDEALGGGWARGELSELVGGRSSGRTSVMLATLAAATARHEIVALVDAFDRFDPASAIEAGVEIERLLWVRGPACTVEMARPGLLEQGVRRALRAFDLIVRAGGFAVIVLDVADVPSLFFRALPATTWMRLARANEGRDTACLLVGAVHLARSARGVSVRLEASARWAGASLQSRRLGGLDVEAVFAQGRVAVERASWAIRAEDRDVCLSAP
jgi:RecA/RadA recombinase